MPAVARAHATGNATLSRDLTVNDPSVIQTGRQLRSLLYTYEQVVLSGGSVDLQTVEFRDAFAKRAKADSRFAIKDGVVTLKAATMVTDELKSKVVQGVDLASLLDGELAQVNTLVNAGRATICNFSNAAFFISHSAPRRSGCVTLFSVLTKTSSVAKFQHGLIANTG